jgi:hypothetical protein
MTPSLPITGAVEQPERLSPAERLQITWALVWPASALALAYSLLRSHLPLSATLLEDMDDVLDILAFFLFHTWVIRRTVRLNHLLVIRASVPEGTPAMTYRESLSVTWLITWRLAAIGGVLALLAIIAFGVTACAAVNLNSPLAALCASAAEFLIFYVWLVNAALNKPYARFSLRLDR